MVAQTEPAMAAPRDRSGLEGVGADDAGNVYAGYNNMNLRRFVKK